MTTYGKAEYWDDRYQRDAEPFDWFQKYAGLKPILMDIGLKAEDSILMLGCGTSKMTEEMYDEGFLHITNIDISSVCISTMQARHASKPELKYLVMNTIDMKEFNDESFDIIIDKGAFDCILCGDKSFENAETMLGEVSRILKPGGTYLIVSYGAPKFRLTHLQKETLTWTVSIKTIQKPVIQVQPAVEEAGNVHYMYVCKKTELKRVDGSTADAAKGEGEAGEDVKDDNENEKFNLEEA